MKYTLTGLGYYISTPGGASAYRNTNNNEIFFECITSGAVYAPSGRTLCGPGWIFAHQAG
ncbi:hypothetical protein H8D64_00905, partial [PVC group bacterium]|nr:hypothetical protein [PVC group bacterium]